MDKKVKIAMITSSLTRNGISSVIMNYCRNINLEKFQISIYAGLPIDDVYRMECEKIGIEIIQLPDRSKSLFKYYISLLKKMPKNKYDIIHVHGNSSIMAIDLFIGWLKNIKTRIAHCHNTKCNNIKVHKILNPIFKKLYTSAFACGKLAGDWIFGRNNYIIINNGIKLNKFIFNKEIRIKERNNLDIRDDEFIIGHVGRINNQKNQEYLIKIFEKCAQIDKKIKLLMIGNGPNYNRIAQIVKNNKYKDRIILYGETITPEKFYNVMDVFVFPSLYEGFPVTVVEALASGLNCLISNSITQEIDSNHVEFIGIEENDINDWVKSILQIAKYSKRNDIEEKIIENFEISNCVKKLEGYYNDFMKEV